ncbi:MAG: glycoside hydrolase family 3 N-terminal domain-containing protein [Clostridia bacterium]|nr:glycoside hydrolase family 3 N-terminal domain-containing protein [Clostridia bacterium]
MKINRRILSTLCAAALLTSTLTPAAFAESGAKWTEETQKDGWIKVTQEGGATLGYSPDSGVTLLTVDGYAFKDLDRDGELDVYEDWREDANTRAKDLADRLDDKAIAALMTHGDLNGMEMDASNATLAMAAPGSDVEYDPSEADMVNTVLPKGLRTFISRLSSMPALSQAKLHNNLQKTAESLDYGIPILFTTDPRSAYADGTTNLAMASTFDPELIGEMYQDLARIYRAVGIDEVLGPQIDLTTEPRWSRYSGTFGEDPALSRDMTKAAIDGFQSTYDDEGNDLGWGEESILSMMKHWPSDGAAESGREAHKPTGKYNVYPGESFATGTIPFVDGGLSLDGETGTVSAVMTSYSIAYTDDESLGELVGSGYSEYKVQLLRSYGFDGLICTDGGIVDDKNTGHGVDNLNGTERVYKILSAGVDQILGFKDIPTYAEEAFQMFVDDIGEEAALARYRDSARRILKSHFQVGLFENPYVDTAHAVEAVESDMYKTVVDEVAEKSVIMLKNSDGTIRAAGEEKPTVYIPMKYQAASRTAAAGFALPIDQKLADTYFNVVTDTVGEPTGEADANGKATYTESDIIRASAEEVAACDYALVFVTSPSSGIGYDTEAEEYVPISLQYSEYTANSEAVRSESIAGDLIVSQVESPYGMIQSSEKENRSYYGKSVTASNAADLDLILDTAALMPETAKTIVAVTANRPMVFGEFEGEVDAILVNLGVKDEAVVKIVAGQAEPSGLLPMQMPKDMAAVEAQLEDVPRDVECYVDADGNTYDFAFGLNWSGVIDDERVAKYNVPALTEPELQPVE